MRKIIAIILIPLQICIATSYSLANPNTEDYYFRHTPPPRTTGITAVSTPRTTTLISPSSYLSSSGYQRWRNQEVANSPASAKMSYPPHNPGWYLRNANPDRPASDPAAQPVIQHLGGKGYQGATHRPTPNPRSGFLFDRHNVDTDDPRNDPRRGRGYNRAPEPVTQPVVRHRGGKSYQGTDTHLADPKIASGPGWNFLAPQDNLGNQLKADLATIFSQSDVSSRFVASVDLVTLGGTSNYIRANVEANAEGLGVLSGKRLGAATRLGLTAVAIPGSGGAALAYGLPAVGIGTAPALSTWILPTAVPAISGAVSEAGWAATDFSLRVLPTQTGRILAGIAALPVVQKIINNPTVQSGWGKLTEFAQIPAVQRGGQQVLAVLGAYGQAQLTSQTGLTPGDQMQALIGAIPALTLILQNANTGYAIGYKNFVNGQKPDMDLVAFQKIIFVEKPIPLVATNGELSVRSDPALSSVFLSPNDLPATRPKNILLVVGPLDDDALSGAIRSYYGQFPSNGEPLRIATNGEELGYLLNLPGDSPSTLYILGHGDPPLGNGKYPHVSEQIGSYFINFIDRQTAQTLSVSGRDLGGSLVEIGVNQEKVGNIFMHSCYTGTGGEGLRYIDAVKFSMLEEGVDIPITGPIGPIMLLRESRDSYLLRLATHGGMAEAVPFFNNDEFIRFAVEGIARLTSVGK